MALEGFSMTALAALAMIQADAQLAAQVDRIAWAQIVMAVAMAILALILIGIGVMAFIALRGANRILARVEKSVQELTPHAKPLIERATRIATDASDVSDTVRRRTNELMDTVADMNRSLREASHAAEERVRDFAAVLEVVQQEAEQVLLDTAATARGLHATAESLRGDGPRPRRVGPARRQPETEKSEED
jgi:uncharacterized protein YoxC